MQIRTMTPEDLPVVARIFHDVSHEVYRPIVSSSFLEASTLDHARERFQKLMALPSAFGFIAEEDGQVLGFATGARPETPRTEFRGDLKTFYVLPDYQGRGIGKQLFMCVVKEFRGRGVESMALEVFAENHSARRIYETFGGEHIEDCSKQILGETYRLSVYGWRTLGSFG